MLDSAVKIINFLPTLSTHHRIKHSAIFRIWRRRIARGVREKNNSIKANVYSTNEYISTVMERESLLSFYLFIVILWQQKCGTWWWLLVKSFTLLFTPKKFTEITCLILIGGEYSWKIYCAHKAFKSFSTLRHVNFDKLRKEETSVLH